MKATRTKPRRASVTTSVDAEIGARLKARRVRLGLSQPHVAACVGVTFQQLQKYEMGVNRVSAARLVELAKVLKTDPVAFLPSRPKPEAERMTSQRKTPLAAQMQDVFVRVSPRGQRMLLDLARTLARTEPAQPDRGDER